MPSLGARVLRVLTLIISLPATLAASAQSDIDIEKFTNGQDADTAPGPAILVGSTVSWTYVVSNISSRPLTNIGVTDDQGVVVTCPATTLGAGLSFTCTGSGTAVLGQYANIGTVEGTLPDASVVSDSDPSHYFGQSAPSVTIEKRTNGLDADAPPGPIVPIGSNVNWEYVITNIGAEALDDIVVSDDQGVTVSCPGTTLAIGASMTCTGSGTAQVGQYANIGTVEATLSVSENGVVASDRSHYFGQTLSLVKRTNGIDAGAPPGPVLNPGSIVSWTYEVTNPGPATVTGLTVTDDQGVTVSCTQTTLVPGEGVICTGSGTVQFGQYTNVGTATAALPDAQTVSASDSSFYFGNEIGIVKSTNGANADTAPGPSLAVGDPVNWTYEVTNFGADTLTDITVTDDQGVTVTCPGTSLGPGASMTCTAAGVAVAGQYANIGTVQATTPSLAVLTSSNPSHYFGQSDALDYGDAPDPTYPTLFVSNGARHILGGVVFLGNCVDTEAEAFASAGADGDDLATTTPFGNCVVAGDDEDGVTFTTALTVGQMASVDVVASAPCTLSAWIDSSGDGDWSDPNEELFPGGSALIAGTNSLNFTVPATAAIGSTFSRFRCTTDGAVGFTGVANDGEVEDHPVTIAAAPSVAATKTDVLFNDVDGDTLAEPGDTLRYTIIITNSGGGDATAVFFTDTPDGNTSLITGSVTTSAGTVASGNGGGDTSVSVNVGTIAAAASATIVFDVLIDDPLPPGTTTVANQGTVTGTNFADVLTDDPAVAGATDPTVTPVTLLPIVSATKTAALFIDVDGDNAADPGDTLRYTITVANTGNDDEPGVVFNDTPDSNTALVNGSVTTNIGAVATGNTPGDTTVSINIGTLIAGGSATIVFDVTIDNPLAPGVTEVVNSGTVTGSTIAPVTTDDPSLPGNADGTAFPIAAAPASLAPIPTAGTWALLALCSMLGIIALRKIATG
ncbi:MAG: GEVED domain-containing protein [Acidobacteriota bacterium]|nr:GEVED domain-containing protein [Acidobacteriota bacterium]